MQNCLHLILKRLVKKHYYSCYRLVFSCFSILMKKVLICKGVINEYQSRAEDSNGYLNAPHSKRFGGWGGGGLSEGARPHTKTGTFGVVL